MTRKPTENGEAYLAFVQAHDLSCAYEDPAKLKQSEQLYQRAVDLDPKFALALARYSQLESWMVRHRSRRRNVGTKRAAWPSGPCNYSLICRKLIWRWGSRITMATTITTRR